MIERPHKMRKKSSGASIESKDNFYPFYHASDNRMSPFEKFKAIISKMIFKLWFIFKFNHSKWIDLFLLLKFFTEKKYFIYIKIISVITFEYPCWFLFNSKL